MCGIIYKHGQRKENEMKNKTDAQKALEDSGTCKDNLQVEIKEYISGTSDMVMIHSNNLKVNFCIECVPRDIAPIILKALTNPEKLNTSEKHVNETANNEHVLEALDKIFGNLTYSESLRNVDYFYCLRNFIQSKQGNPWQPTDYKAPPEICSNQNALAWAKYFTGVFPDHKHMEDVMFGWFANAMMAVRISEDIQQTVDVEATYNTRKPVIEQINTEIVLNDDQLNCVELGMNRIIDHLHKNGHLNTNVPSDMVLVPREYTIVLRDACEGINTFEATNLFGKESRKRLGKAIAMIQASEAQKND